MTPRKKSSPLLSVWPIIASTVAVITAILGLWRNMESRLVEIQVKLDVLQTSRVETKSDLAKLEDRVRLLEREMSSIGGRR